MTTKKKLRRRIRKLRRQRDEARAFNEASDLRAERLRQDRDEWKRKAST